MSIWCAKAALHLTAAKNLANFIPFLENMPLELWAILCHVIKTLVGCGRRKAEIFLRTGEKYRSLIYGLRAGPTPSR